LSSCPALTASKPASTPVAVAAPASKAEAPRPKAASRPQEPQSDDDDDDSDRAGAQSDVQPVGPDYVDEVGETVIGYA